MATFRVKEIMQYPKVTHRSTAVLQCRMCPFGIRRGEEYYDGGEGLRFHTDHHVFSERQGKGSGK